MKNTELKELQVKDLKFLPFNREINHAQAFKLEQSMNNHGILRTPVIVETKAITGKKEYYIVDGQHMITALIKNDVETVTCIVFESENKREIVDTMATLNNVVSKWTIANYVEAFASLGSQDYMILKLASHKTGLSLTICAEILGNKSLVKLGKFTCFKSDANQMFKNIVDVVSIVKSNRMHYIRGFITFVRSLGDYDHNQLINNLILLNKEYLGKTDNSLSYELFHKIYKGEQI